MVQSVRYTYKCIESAYAIIIEDDDKIISCSRCGTSFKSSKCEKNIWILVKAYELGEDFSNFMQ